MTGNSTEFSHGSTPRERSESSTDPLFEGPGEMRALCGAFDWAETPLGPPGEWSQSLRTVVGIVLGSRNPMFLWWGPELIQIYNDAYRPSFGARGRHPSALGMRGADCWTDIWEEIGPQIAQVMSGGDSTWHEDQYLPIERNGRLEDVWWTYSYSAVRDDDDSIGGTLVVCQETTSRVVAESALRESEARYRTLFESLDEGFCVLEIILDEARRPIDYRFIEANPAFERQTGLIGAIGRTAHEMVPDLEPEWVDVYARVALTGEPTRFQSGSEPMGRWFDVYAFRVGRPEEQRVALLFNDITAARDAERERERLLRELEVERARLEEVFRQAPSFLAVLRGPDHVFELVNDAYYQLVGHRRLLGLPVFEALPEVREQGFEELIDDVLTRGEPFVGRELPLLIARTPGAAPEERFVDLTYLPLVESDGTRSGIIAHGTDVTEQVLARRRVEVLLRESERARAEAESARVAAEAADIAKTQFLANMSHELRTPLNAIQGHVQLLDLELHGPVTERQRAALGRIDRAQRHLLGLVNDVLNYARLGSGRVEYDVEPVILAEVVADVLPMVEPQLADKELTLETRYPERSSAADASGAVLVLADREKLGQVLLNLLSNAVKFTPSNGRITVELADPEDGGTGDMVHVRVSDTGIGIPSDRFEAIFEPFVQVRTEYARSYGGTGLGLAISRDLARGMGGDLTVESTPGVGSIFTLTLRRASPSS